MKQVSELISEIQTHLNIPSAEGEKQVEYFFRLAYSLAGRWALESLYDRENNEASSVSVQHFKKTFINVFQSIFTLPKEKVELNVLADYVFDIYKKGGVFYQSGLALYAVPRVESILDNIKFLRGLNPREGVFMSGLGPYTFSDEKNSDNPHLFWDLNLDRCLPILKYFSEGAQWEQYQGNSNELEIFNVKKSKWRFYWDRGDDLEGVSLAQSISQPRQYYLCKLQTQQEMTFLYVSPLPDFFRENKLWRDLAWALTLQYYGSVERTIESCGPYYSIDLNYVPSQIRAFLRLYSWLKYDNLPYEAFLIKREVMDALIPTFEKYNFYVRVR